MADEKQNQQTSETGQDAPESTDVPVEQTVEALKAERDASHEKWLRAEAELENLRRRTRNELNELQKYQSLPVVRDLLSPLDNLRRALDAAQSSGNVDELVKGIQMVLDQFENVLKAHNVEAIGGEGAVFDPNQHEAIQQIPSAEHEPMTVLNEVERGYRMHDRVIRPSKVVVSSAPPEDQQGDASDG